MIELNSFLNVVSRIDDSPFFHYFHHAGDFASQTITQNLGSYKQAKSLEESILLLEDNIINTNSLIRKKAAKLGKNTTIGATVVCARARLEPSSTWYL